MNQLIKFELIYSQAVKKPKNQIKTSVEISHRSHVKSKADDQPYRRTQKSKVKAQRNQTKKRRPLRHIHRLLPRILQNPQLHR